MNSAAKDSSGSSGPARRCSGPTGSLPWKRGTRPGIAPLAQAELLGPAEKIRALCQGVLRNRFYTEADWRGEDYDVPAFWLGPRPYE